MSDDLQVSNRCVYVCVLGIWYILWQSVVIVIKIIIIIIIIIIISIIIGIMEMIGSAESRNTICGSHFGWRTATLVYGFAPVLPVGPFATLGNLN